ncbi:MAG: transcription-repair coupling factor [Pseudomonadota bacterium]
MTLALPSPTAPPPTGRLNWRGVHGLAQTLAACAAATDHKGPTLLIAATTGAARRIAREARVVAPDDLPIHYLPDWETLPYDAFSPHQDIVSERLTTLAQLGSLQRGLIIVALPSVMQRLPPVGYVQAESFELAVGARFDIETERARLANAGYLAVSTVTERGQFAVRGALVDVFPMGAEAPIRIDLLDDEIDTLRTFDPDTQRSVDRLEALRMLPAREFPVVDAAISRFRHTWHERFDVDVRRCPVYQDVSAGVMPAGVEYYLPLFFDTPLATLFEYLPAQTLVVHCAELDEAAESFLSQVEGRFQSLGYDIERPLLPTGELYLNLEELRTRMAAFPRAGINAPHKYEVDLGCRALPAFAAGIRAREPSQALIDFVAAAEQPVLFVAESPGRRELVETFLGRAGIDATPVPSWVDWLQAPPSLGLLVAPLDRGTQAPNFAVITETELYGARPPADAATQRQRIDADQIVRNLNELHIGAPVVHLDHGVGRYLGLTTLTIDGADSEYLALEYFEAAKLYVPVASLHLIARYSGSDEASAPLHRLGSDQWEKAKRKAAEKAFDVAAELLNLYATRASRQTDALTAVQADYERFAGQFEFQPTADQQLAIDSVVADMGQTQPMDRLVCGDVGFGKTEVALRAAFVAVQNQQQVAVLVPTTLLAQQHGESFRDRFADWPVRVEVISRLRADSEVEQVLNDVRSGKVDILIGTHRLLGRGLDFAGLGLVIVDEEHRFGVRQKERLKTLRAEVHLLTLTATPIPRTLNMAIGGIRDLSIIATPPAKRLSIRTFVQEKRNHVVREALSRELMRGGQAFYVHNEVRTIEQTAQELAELIPEARIGIGHGQMPKRELERVMSDFQHRRCNVLLCTTIIETGIDIPNANTIIINRADKFGLAQLHQLRGRVGRSTRQAYAYLLTPHHSALTADAKKRLEAIEAAGDLGIGFTLATHDMEIRGAGELLGDEQSGQIEEVGFSLYMDMLERAVRAIRGGKTPDVKAPFETSQEVNLHAPALIPETFMADVHARLIAYKRIASAPDEPALDELRAEFIDRYGSLPVQLDTLFQITALKLGAAPLGIARIDLGDKGGKLEFQAATPVEPMAIIELVQKSGGVFRMEGATTLRVRKDLADFAARAELVTSLLVKLAPKSTDSAATGSIGVESSRTSKAGSGTEHVESAATPRDGTQSAQQPKPDAGQQPARQKLSRKDRKRARRLRG